MATRLAPKPASASGLIVSRMCAWKLRLPPFSSWMDQSAREPAAGELLGYEFARQRDVLLKRQFGRKCDLDLAGELRVLALFERLRRGSKALPKPLPVRRHGAPKAPAPMAARLRKS